MRKTKTPGWEGNGGRTVDRRVHKN
jgi:hypothetical protein